jgi:hypothetical protein
MPFQNFLYFLPSSGPCPENPEGQLSDALGKVDGDSGPARVLGSQPVKAHNILHVLDRFGSGEREIKLHVFFDFAESVIFTEQSLNCTRLYCSSADMEAPKGRAKGARKHLMQC